MNGESAVLMQIARLPGADAMQTARSVRAMLGDLAARLPPGVRFQVLGDESLRLGEELDDLVRRGLIAFVGRALILAVALQAPRAVCLVMASAAVAVAGTTLGLYLLGIPANLLTLAGLGMGVGILVQNGVIVVDRFRTVPDTAEARRRRPADHPGGARLDTDHRGGAVALPLSAGRCARGLHAFRRRVRLALGWSIITSVVMLPALGRRSRHARRALARSTRLYRQS